MGVIKKGDPRFEDSIINQRIQERCNSTTNIQAAIIGYLRSPAISSGKPISVPISPEKPDEGERVISKLEQAIDEGMTTYYNKFCVDLDIKYPMIVPHDIDFLDSEDLGKPKVAIYGSRLSINPEIEVLARGAFAGAGNPAIDGSKDRMAVVVQYKTDAKGAETEPSIWNCGTPIADKNSSSHRAYTKLAVLAESIRRIIGGRTILTDEFPIVELGKKYTDFPEYFGEENGPPDLSQDESFIPENPPENPPEDQKKTGKPRLYNLCRDFNINSIGVEELEMPSLRNILEFGGIVGSGLAAFNFTVTTGRLNE